MPTVLRRLRRDRHISQEALADILGCSQPAVVNWESGRHVPRNPRKRARLEALFGVPVEALFANDNGVPEDPAVTRNEEVHRVC